MLKIYLLASAGIIFFSCSSLFALGRRGGGGDTQPLIFNWTAYSTCSELGNLREVNFDIYGTDELPQYANPYAGENFYGQDLQKLLDCQLSPDRVDQDLVVNLRTTNVNSYLIVKDRLRVHSNTMLNGVKNGFIQDYGAVLVGANVNTQGSPQTESGRQYRSSPIIEIRGAANSKRGNISIYNLEFKGKLSYSPIEIVDAGVIPKTNTIDASGYSINIIFNRITGSRGGGVNCTNCDKASVNYLSLTAVRKNSMDIDDNPTAEGGSSIWFKNSTNSIIENNIIQAPEFYFAGPPSDSGDPRACYPGNPYTGCLDPIANNLARALSLVGIYGGNNITIAHNKLFYNNTTGIYLAPSQESRPTNMTVWDNSIQYSRELGLDLFQADGVQVMANQILHSDSASIGVADVHGGNFQYNVLTDSGNYNNLNIPGVGKIGTIHLSVQSSNNSFSSNIIDSSKSDYQIYIKENSRNNLFQFNYDLSYYAPSAWTTDQGCLNPLGNSVLAVGTNVPCVP